MKKTMLGFWITLLFFLMGSNTFAVDFEIEIRVSVPDVLGDNGKATNRLRAGGNKEATMGFDPLFDVPAYFYEDSNNPAPLKAYFPHPELPYETGNPVTEFLWRDFRNGKFSWIFEVSSSRDESPITIQWLASVSSSGCEDVEFKLTDKGSGQVIDMQMATNYTYTNENGKNRRFLLNATPIQTSSPQTPGQLWSPRQGKSGILLTWSLPSGGDDVGYRIERHQGTGFFQALVTVPLSTNKFLDRNIVRGNTYTYQVIAESSSGCQSGSSEELTLTIP